MKKAFQYLIAAGIAVSGCNNTDDISKKQQARQQAMLQKEIMLEQITVYDEADNNIDSVITKKFDTIEEIRYATVKDQVNFGLPPSGSEATMEIFIYKFATPDKKELKIASAPRDLMRGENHSIKYFELKKGEVLTSGNLTDIIYGRYTSVKKIIYKDLDGVMIDYEPIKTRDER